MGTGKIARLPVHIREQVNRRLEKGDNGRDISAWLNSNDEVKAVLAQEFDGQPLNDVNLSHWRQGGYRDWEAQQFALAEAGRILEEGHASRASDIDAIYFSGYGFPAYRGGPMWYADTVGVKKVYDKVEEFHKKHGELWEPAPLLKRLAAEGRSFASLDGQE